MFRKVMRDPPIGQLAFTFSILGFLNAATLWPVCIALCLSGAEVMPWDTLPWAILLVASVLLLGLNSMLNCFSFSIMISFQFFIF